MTRSTDQLCDTLVLSIGFCVHHLTVADWLTACCRQLIILAEIRFSGRCRFAVVAVVEVKRRMITWTFHRDRRN